MKYTGTYLGRLQCSHHGLVDRQILFYQTKKGITGYLFNSGVKGWERKENLLKKLTLETDDIVSVFPLFVQMFGYEEHEWSGEIYFKDITIKYNYHHAPIKYLTTYGEYYFDSAGIKIHCGDTTSNGECFKDKHAWNTGKGIIYIGEYGLTDGILCEDEMDNDSQTFWTRKSWIEWVRDWIKASYTDTEEDGFKVDDLLRDNGYIEYISESILDECDWQDLSTMLNELDDDDFFYENWISYKERKQK